MDAGIREIFKRNLKAARKGRGLTQKDVADRLKVEPRYYQKIEYGDVWPSPEYIKRLCRAIGCEERELFEGPLNAPTIDFKHIETAVLAAVKEAAVSAHPSLPPSLLDALSALKQEQLGTVESFARKLLKQSLKPLKRRKGLD